MSGALTLREGGEFFEGLVKEERGGERGPSAYRSRGAGELSLQEGAQELTALISGNVVDFPGEARNTPARRPQKRGELSLDEGAEELAALVTRPRKRSGRKAEVDDSATVEDVVAAEKRGHLLSQASIAMDVARLEYQRLHDYISSIAAQFPTVRGADDLVRLSQVDPIGYMQIKAHSENFAQLWPHVQQTMVKAVAIRQAAFDEFAIFEDAQFQRQNPDWEPSMAFEIATMLDASGVSQTELDALYNSPTQLNLGDPRSMKIIEDAACFHTGRKLAGAIEVWPALIDTFSAVGFSDQEIASISQGGPVSLREHRIQTLLVWALKWQQQEGGK